jgi:hypothetical protein
LLEWLEANDRKRTRIVREQVGADGDQAIPTEDPQEWGEDSESQEDSTEEECDPIYNPEAMDKDTLHNLKFEQQELRWNPPKGYPGDKWSWRAENYDPEINTLNKYDGEMLTQTYMKPQRTPRVVDMGEPFDMDYVEAEFDENGNRVSQDGLLKPTVIIVDDLSYSREEWAEIQETIRRINDL